MPRKIKLVSDALSKEGTTYKGAYCINHYPTKYASMTFHGTTTAYLDFTTGILRTGGYSRTDLDSVSSFAEYFGYYDVKHVADLGKSFDKEGEVDVP